MTAPPSKAHAVPFPTTSGLALYMPGCHLADAFAIALPAGATHDPEILANLVLAEPAPWVQTLMGIRNAAVRPFGIKTSGEIGAALRRSRSRRIGFFGILSVTPDEVIVGEKDRHLDFRASLLVRPLADPGAYEMVAATVVHCHNRLGRLYLATIAPFHRLIARSNLRRARDALLRRSD